MLSGMKDIAFRPDVLHKWIAGFPPHPCTGSTALDTSRRSKQQTLCSQRVKAPTEAQNEI